MELKPVVNHGISTTYISTGQCRISSINRSRENLKLKRLDMKMLNCCTLMGSSRADEDQKSRVESHGGERLQQQAT